VRGLTRRPGRVMVRFGKKKEGRVYLRKLKNGKTITVSGSHSGFGGANYDIKKENNIVSCSCMAYKTCKYPAEQKFCKHILFYIDPKCFGEDVPSKLINKTSKNLW